MAGWLLASGAMKIGRVWQFAGLGVLALATSVIVGLVVSGASLSPAPAYTPPPLHPSAGPTTPTAHTLAPLKLPGKGGEVLVMGDSWATGYSADKGRGFVDVLRKLTGWKVATDAQSGTGYVAVLGNGGQTFPVRASKLGGAAPELVLLEGGINDQGESADAVTSAATQTIGTIHGAYPDAEIVLVGPGTGAWPISSKLVVIDRALRSAADDAQVYYVSPLTDRWITEANFKTFIDPKTGHPGNDGHEVFATKLLATLTDLAS